MEGYRLISVRVASVSAVQHAYTVVVWPVTITMFPYGIVTVAIWPAGRA